MEYPAHPKKQVRSVQKAKLLYLANKAQQKYKC